MNMPRDILSEYGHDIPMHEKLRATNGGVMPVRDVMGYQPPVGPIGLGHNSPGLGGHNCGNAGTQGKHSYSDHETSGRPGLHPHTNHGMGTNRKG